MKKLIFSLCLVGSYSFADDVAVPNTFSPDTTISSSQMNANFTALVDESNENDSRLAAAEGSIQSLTALVEGRTYTWLGYTQDTFPYDAASYRTSLFTANNFCKAQFGNSAAQVATTEILAAVSAANQLPLPLSAALVAPVYSAAATGTNSTISYAIDYWGVASSGTADWCLLSSLGDFSCNVSQGSAWSNYLLACVTQSQ